jgi:hypothetical protein
VARWILRDDPQRLAEVGERVGQRCKG